MKKPLSLLSLVAILILFSCHKEQGTKQLSGPVTACFTCPKDTFYVGDTVSFGNCSLNADTFLYLFGDGGSSSLHSPMHIFAQSGSYVVSLRVAKQNQSNTISKTIFIKQGIPSDLPWRYFKPSSNYDSMVFTGTGNGHFIINGYRLLDGNINATANFTQGDSFTYNFNSGSTVSINGVGYFSQHDSSVTMSIYMITSDQSGNPIFTNDTFFGIRR